MREVVVTAVVFTFAFGGTATVRHNAATTIQAPAYESQASQDTVVCVVGRNRPDSLPVLTADQQKRFGSELLRHVRDHQACVGMPKEVLVASWGLPPTMQVQHRGRTRYDKWIYPDCVVFLEDSIVTAIRKSPPV
jgi:hypothetical protein